MTGRTLADYVAQGKERGFAIEGWDALWAELQEDVLRPLTPKLKDAVRPGVREEGGRLIGGADAEAYGAA